MSLATIVTLQADVTLDAATPEVEVTRFGDGRIEFTDVNGNKVVAHSNVELRKLLDVLLSVD